MSIKYLSSIDLAKNQLLNAVIQNLASAPGSPVEGLAYFDTVLHQLGVYQNGSWVYLGASGGGNVSKASNAAAANTLQVSNSTDKALVDFSSAGGIPKVTAGGVVSIATPGTDYSTPSATETFTNKTLNAAGTGNVLSNIATSMFASNVVDTDGTLAANSDTRLASQKVTKTYVDSAIQGIQWKAPVRAATTASGTLASAYANGSAIDGVTLATGDRILLKDQSSGAENGIYTVNASGAPTRAVDMDANTEVPNFVVDVREGTVNADQAFVCTNNGAITIGSTALVIVDFVKAAIPTATTSVAGKVLLASQAEAEAKTDTAKAVVSADLTNFPIKKIATIGDGVTTAIAVTHNLGSKDVISQVRDASTDAVVLCDIVNTSTTVTTFTFAVAPASNAIKVVIIG